MAGGTWIAQNKVRPGAYINFESVPAPTSNVGTRGIMTMPVVSSWGPEGEIIKLYSTELLDGGSLEKVGVSAFDEGSLIYREALSSAYLALVYRINKGGEYASGQLGELQLQAKYSGETGNQLSVSIVENRIDETKLDVITFLNGSERDRQTVSPDGEGLEDNAFVLFELAEGADLAIAAGTPLSGGTNGTVLPAHYADYFDALDEQTWNTMAMPSSDNTVKANTLTYIQNRRENTGRKCQAVLLDYDADYEGIINVSQGYVNLSGEEVTPELFTVTVAGMTAGAEINESNTYRVITNADTIINPIKDVDVEAALQSGRFILTRRQDGTIVVEQDINSFHRFTPYKDYAFSKNRVIRVLDDIGNQIKIRFENAYIGKVDNNETGRQVLRADIISYMNELQGIGAIQNFLPDSDIAIKQGMSIDSVVADLWIQPVDAMEKLYLQVYVSQNDTAQTDRGNR